MNSTIDLITSSNLSQCCNALESEDKRKRKDALVKIEEALFKDNSGIILEERVKDIYKQVLRCFSDKAEVCREKAIHIIIGIMEEIPEDKNECLSYVIPITVQRIGGIEIIEPSEEVRFLLVNLYRIIINKFSVVNYVEELVQILMKILVDPYPKIKKEACECASDLSKTVPKQLYSHTTSLVKLILQNFGHQHSKVRVAAIQAIGEVLCRGDSKAVEIVLVPMAERLFDQSPAVRRAIIEVVGMWMLKMPDRYSFHGRLMPIFLTGLSDTISEIRELTAKMWNDIGQQYQNENEHENDLKDKIDFLSPALPPHYPSGVTRPSLGCRELARRHLYNLVPILGTELQDWRADVRLRSAQLLTVLLLHAEDRAMHYFPKLVDILASASHDEDPRVAENVTVAAEIVGYFIPIDSWLKLLLPVAGDIISSGRITVLASVLHGCELSSLAPHLKQFEDFLSITDVCYSKQGSVQKPVLDCCAILLQVGDSEASFGYQIFHTLLAIQALAANNQLSDFAVELQIRQQQKYGLDSREDLFSLYLSALMKEIKESASAWSSCCSESYMFETILAEAGYALSEVMEDLAIVLCLALNKDRDPEQRLRCYTFLSCLLIKYPSILEKPGAVAFTSSLISDALIPGLVWHAGRTAEALRSAAVMALYALLSPLHNAHNIELNALLPLLSALIEDSAQRTRVTSLTCTSRVCELIHEQNKLSWNDLTDIYPVVLKRLDDVDKEVRITSVHTMDKLLNLLSTMSETGSIFSHLQFIFDTLLIHLDDPDKNFQAVVLDGLKKMGSTDPKLLKQKAEDFKSNFRNPIICENLLMYLDNLTVNEGVINEHKVQQ